MKQRTFGEQLLSLRKAARLTQHALGQDVGLDQGRISKLETDTMEPTVETVERLAKRLGVSRFALIGARPSSSGSANRARGNGSFRAGSAAYNSNSATSRLKPGVTASLRRSLRFHGRARDGCT
jgi:transcriptional regulator with XRE-family HTH domain